MTKTQHHFRYADARADFLKRVAGAEHTVHVHPNPGPDGEIAMDIAHWHGPAHGNRVLVISSGTHGIEGYCGSFVQCALLDSGLAKKITERASLLMIHGVNPYGFAWQRRVNENNVDLNRNFINHQQLHPVNAGYEQIAQLLEPTTWDAGTGKQIAGELVSIARQHGQDPRWLQTAWSGGQYQYPMGQFYGGLAPQWSNERIQQLVQSTLAQSEITWVDLHTALGEFGTAQCIVEMDPGSTKLKEAQQLWGDRVGNIRSQSSVAIEISGSILMGVEACLQRPFLGTSLEYGTVSAMEVGGALIQDQFLHRYGELESEFGVQTKQRMMNAFYPDDEGWRSAVLDIAHATVQAVLDQP